MKKSLRIFREAERLQPSPALWRRIAAASGLESGPHREGFRPWETPWLRAAAAVLLAAGLIAVAVKGFHSQGRAEQGAELAKATPKPPAQAAVGDSEIIDSELMGWQADLGEVDLEAEAAEEVL